MTDTQVADTMLRLGGHFIRHLAQAFLVADVHNQARIKAAFDREWRHYVELTELAERRPNTPHCPACGSSRWFYDGDRQTCAACGA